MKRNTVIALTAVALALLFGAYVWTGMTPTMPVPKSAPDTDPNLKHIALSVGYDSPFLYYAEFINEYERAHPDVRISVNSIPTATTDYRYEKYKTAFSAGQNDADIILTDLIWLPEFARAGWVMNLEDRFAPAQRDRFLPLALASCRVDGALFAVPCMIDVPVLFYRTDLVETPPRTYEELIEVGGALARENGLPYAYVFPAQVSEALVCAGMDILLGCGANPRQRGDQLRYGMEMIRQLIQCNPDPQGLLNFVEKDARVAFSSGDAVFMRNWQQNYAQLMEAEGSQIQGKFSVAPLPAGASGGQYGTGTVGGWHFAINSQCENPETAFDVLMAITSDENQRFNCQSVGFPPVVSGLYKDAALTARFSPLKEPGALYENMQFRPQRADYMNISNRLSAILYGVASGSLSPELASDQMAAALLAGEGR